MSVAYPLPHLRGRLWARIGHGVRCRVRCRVRRGVRRGVRCRVRCGVRRGVRCRVRRGVRCGVRCGVRFGGFPEQQNGGTDPVRSITRVDAQANAHTGRSHSHVHRCGVHPVTLRHVTPVLQDRLPALCVDLHNTHLASLRYASRYRNRHGGGYPRLRVHLESVTYCDDANAGQRYRRRRVGMQVLASNSSLPHCVTDARPQLRSFRSCKVDLGIILRLEVVRANNLEVCDARRQDHDARHRTMESDARHSFPKENALPRLRLIMSKEVKSCVYASTHDDVSRHVTPRTCDSKLSHLRTVLDGDGPRAGRCVNNFYRIGDDEVDQVRTSIERVRTNSRQAVGKDDSSQRRNIFECVWTDLSGPCRNHKLCHGTRWRHDDQRLPSLSLFEKAATIDEIVGVTWAESNRSKLLIPPKSRTLNRNKVSSEVNRRQCSGRKRIPTDGLHRIR